jgi:hypothetical protein
LLPFSRLFALFLVAALAAALSLGLALATLLRLAFPGGSAFALIRLGLPALTTGPCPASASARHGPALNFVAEGETAAGLLTVLGTLTRRGWYAVTPFSVPLDVVPPAAAVLPLGFAQIRAYQSLSLVETPRRHTRVVSLNAVVFCPP